MILDMRLENKVALVTGASRGIGKAIATVLAEQGAQVIGTATTPEGAERITQDFKAKGLAGAGFTLDVTDVGAMDPLFENIEKDFGTPVILVNNAAITRDNLLLRMKPEEWDTIIETNLTSIYRMTKVCLRGMLKAKWGRIINVSSVVALMGNPGQTNYAAAKAGLIGFSKSLAQEVGSRGITVNIVAPGFIDTEMTQALPEQQREWLLSKIPLQRLGNPNDVACACAFLASPSASYITGETIHVNGGMYMS